MNEKMPANPAAYVSPRARSLMEPHRLVLLAAFVALVLLAGWRLRWDWIAEYWPQLLAGIGRTLVLLFSSAAVGFVFAVLLGLVQVTGPRPLAWLARGFCTTIRGTPLLLQVWLIYYGLGSVFASYPEIRQSMFWPVLRQAWPYGFAALMISFAAYEGEVMRGAFAGVPRGELEAAKAYGMGRRTMFFRIWLPRAIQRVLPTLNGETVLQLKSTPLVATITVVDVYGVISKVRQDTYLTYEPLLLLAAVYLILTGILVWGFKRLEARVPVKGL